MTKGVVKRNSIDDIKLSDLPTGQALVGCRRSALEVFKVWPDETVTPEAMHERAAKFLHVDGHDGAMARHTLCDLIRTCRNYPTIVRSRTFWRIMQGLFTTDEALELYLGQCRGLKSPKQRRLIVRHLQEQGYTKKEITKVMERCQL